jgi:hypothetical protein
MVVVKKFVSLALPRGFDIDTIKTDLDRSWLDRTESRGEGFRTFKEVAREEG